MQIEVCGIVVERSAGGSREVFVVVSVVVLVGQRQAWTIRSGSVSRRRPGGGERCQEEKRVVERQMTQAKEIAWIELQARRNFNNVQKKKELPKRTDKMRQVTPLMTRKNNAHKRRKQERKEKPDTQRKKNSSKTRQNREWDGCEWIRDREVGWMRVAYQGRGTTSESPEGGGRTWAGRRQRLPDAATIVGSRVGLAGVMGPPCHLKKMEAVCALTEISKNACVLDIALLAKRGDVSTTQPLRFVLVGGTNDAEQVGHMPDGLQIAPSRPLLGSGKNPIQHGQQSKTTEIRTVAGQQPTNQEHV